METDGKLTRIVVVGTVLAVTLGNWLANDQDVDSPANPFSIVENWAKLPTERAWGQVIVGVGSLRSKRLHGSNRRND